MILRPKNWKIGLSDNPNETETGRKIVKKNSQIEFYAQFIFCMGLGWSDKKNTTKILYLDYLKYYFRGPMKIY